MSSGTRVDQKKGDIQFGSFLYVTAEEVRGLQEEWRCVPADGNPRMGSFIWLLLHQDRGETWRRSSEHVDLSLKFLPRDGD